MEDLPRFIMIGGEETLVKARVGRQDRFVTQQNVKEAEPGNVPAKDHEANR